LSGNDLAGLPVERQRFARVGPWLLGLAFAVLISHPPGLAGASLWAAGRPATEEIVETLHGVQVNWSTLTATVRVGVAADPLAPAAARARPLALRRARARAVEVFAVAFNRMSGDNRCDACGTFSRQSLLNRLIVKESFESDGGAWVDAEISLGHRRERKSTEATVHEAVVQFFAPLGAPLLNPELTCGHGTFQLGPTSFFRSRERSEQDAQRMDGDTARATPSRREATQKSSPSRRQNGWRELRSPATRRWPSVIPVRRTAPGRYQLPKSVCGDWAHAKMILENEPAVFVLGQVVWGQGQEGAVDVQGPGRFPNGVHNAASHNASRLGPEAEFRQRRPGREMRRRQSPAGVRGGDDRPQGGATRKEKRQQ